jgi:3-methyl-2-oxobutanoate hydroxymethyltransferase
MLIPNPTPEGSPLCQVTPKFCKQYANVGSIIEAALVDYKNEVTSRAFPSAAHTAYR